MEPKIIINDQKVSDKEAKAIGVALVHFKDLIIHGESSTQHNTQQEKEDYLKSIKAVEDLIGLSFS